MQATVVRMKKDLKGENNAREVSDALPFVEYEIHRQLVRTISECLLSLLMFCHCFPFYPLSSCRTSCLSFLHQLVFMTGAW